jgi:hypothetical protein
VRVEEELPRLGVRDELDVVVVALASREKRHRGERRTSRVRRSRGNGMIAFAISDCTVCVDGRQILNGSSMARECYDCHWSGKYRAIQIMRNNSGCSLKNAHLRSAY